MRPTRWSYSSLSTYEECPAKWRYRYVDGLRDPPSPAMERGTRLHALCEMVLNDCSAPVPVDLSAIARHIERLRANQAQAEKVWRLDADWKPAESGGWVKGIVDVHFFKEGTLHIYDFKSGRPYPTHKSQLELYALIGLAVFPEVESAAVGAIYIDAGKIGHKRTLARSDAGPVYTDWAARAHGMLSDQELSATPWRGCYWCSFKDSLGGPCKEWRTAA